MKAAIRWTLALLAAGAVAVSLATSRPPEASQPASHRPELEYLKVVNRAGPAKDPQVIFLLMAQYENAGLRAEGAEFFAGLLSEFGPRLPDRLRSLYLAAIGLLRAGHAADVPFLKRIGWVNDTIDILEDARQLSGGDIFVVRWITGVVYAQLPGFFGRRAAAQADLAWCVDNAAKAPHAGWLREVYYRLAELQRADGNDAEAQRYLRLSGYQAFGKQITLTTPFAEDVPAGHTFHPRRIAELVPGRVYALSGFEFTEYYFVVSENRRELIGIDAGTRPDTAREAYQALRAYAPDLPPLTTILVTHAHWDHVGGHAYFQGLRPSPKFIARSNYRDEIARQLAAPNNLLKQFFGPRYSLEDLTSFTPDVLVEQRTELKLGGTRLELIPADGGETEDALLIHLPDLGVMFAGDIVMPYLGAPFVEEGNLEGLFRAIDAVAEKNPRILLHGHEPLNRVFPSASVLSGMKAHLAWLRAEVLAAIRRGEERAAIHEANLIPPGLPAGDPAVHVPYLVMRENVINRLYDQNIGYWQPGLQGLDHLSRADRGAMLADYLGVSEQQVVKAAERMIADGRHELAAATLDWTREWYGASPAFANAERLAYRKLMEEYQEFNPFKFILYSAKIGERTPQVAPGER